MKEKVVFRGAPSEKSLKTSGLGTVLSEEEDSGEIILPLPKVRQDKIDELLPDPTRAAGGACCEAFPPPVQYLFKLF